MQRIERLDALTSLRFFAAFMIVLHHSRGTLLPPDIISPGWPLDQGVAFFFVLSGFILTYAYPSLPDRKSVLRFWIARLARVWPAHILALVLVIAIVGPQLIASQGIAPLLANALMLQAWIPFQGYFFSYNAVSWSISTELGFYALFPLLILNFRATWFWKLAAAGGLLISLMGLCELIPLPRLGDTQNRVTTFGLLYISPLGRLFEFALGMCTALLWQRTRRLISATGSAWTIAELAVLAFVLWTLRYGTWSFIGMVRNSPLPVAEEWAIHASSCIAFATLVYVMASGQGVLGRMLSFSALVFLGEISYVMYLLHQTMIPVYIGHVLALRLLPPLAIFPGFVILLIAASSAAFHLVERPARALINARRDRIAAAILQTQEIFLPRRRRSEDV